MNPACQTHVPKLSAFVDGELAPKERVAVEQHLAACKACVGRVADLRAESGLVRVGLDLLADEVDFKDFSQKVMARITPERPPFWERFKVGFAELTSYRGPALAGGFAVAGLAVVLGLGLWMRPRAPEGYGAAQASVESVSTDESAHVAPVVMKTEQGTIIWTVDHADNPELNLPPDAGSSAATARPKGGEL
jgi:anti-sigma factor RsiW